MSNNFKESSMSNHFLQANIERNIEFRKKMTVSMIDGSTTVVAVFGDPVAHSLSPVMHNAAFSYLGWNCVYVPFLVKPDYLAEGVRGIKAMNLKGVNVTIPHKQAVSAYLDEIIGDAGPSGSVNTIINRDGKLYGASSDGSGLVKSLEAALWAFYHSETFREGCLLAVNLGDDADTTGAVYGQLAGAFYGADSIPEGWKARLALRELIERFADELANLAWNARR